jgi:hypothetical protein
MSVEVDIHFNTSFRSILSGKNDIFLSEGYCELYSASRLKNIIKTIPGKSVTYILKNEEISEDAYGNQLMAYPLKTILELIKKEYANYLLEINKSSLTVCIGILQAISENSSQESSMVMLNFH